MARYLRGRAFGEQEQVAWGEVTGAEGAEAYPVTRFFEEQRAVEQQPDFQRAAEQGANQFEVAYFGQALPTELFQRCPVLFAGRVQALERGEVAAIVGEWLAQPGG